MSKHEKNYEPTVTPVFVCLWGSHNPSVRPADPEQANAYLVTGAPMIGNRVSCMNMKGTVVEVHLGVTVDFDGRGLWTKGAKSCAPVVEYGAKDALRDCEAVLGLRDGTSAVQRVRDYLTSLVEGADDE